jgi:hypothetical protein
MDHLFKSPSSHATSHAPTATTRKLLDRAEGNITSKDRSGLLGVSAGGTINAQTI